MTSLYAFRNLGKIPSARTLSGDDILELHAARVLMLVYLCGVNSTIDGLTKLAKLDFFVRYPVFFSRTCIYLNKPRPSSVLELGDMSMVRHHYGPWDHRYYHVLSFLEGTGLLSVVKIGGTRYRFALTAEGITRAKRLISHPSYLEQSAHMKQVKKLLSSKNGTTLKKLIYQVFQSEVANQPIGAKI